MSDTPAAEEKFQFSLRGMLLTITGLCVVLAASVAGGLLAGYLVFTVWLFLLFVMYRNLRRYAIGVMICWLSLSGLALAIVLPLVSPARTPALRNGCLNRTRQLALAIANYESAHGEFPPAYTVDAQGNRLHSWRTLILPYLEQKTLYDQIDFSVPWDDPANKPLSNRQLWAYQCPGHPQAGQGNFTTYVAIVGPETMWPGAQSRRFREVKDGIASTIVIIEIARSDIAWAEPRDLTVDEILAAYDAGDVTGMASFHPRDVSMVGYADFHARPIDMQNINRETLRAMLSVAGGEVYDEENLERPPSDISPPADEPEPRDGEPSP